MPKRIPTLKIHMHFPYRNTVSLRPAVTWTSYVYTYRSKNMPLSAQVAARISVQAVWAGGSRFTRSPSRRTPSRRPPGGDTQTHTPAAWHVRQGLTQWRFIATTRIRRSLARDNCCLCGGFGSFRCIDLYVFCELLVWKSETHGPVFGGNRWHCSVGNTRFCLGGCVFQ